MTPSHLRIAGLVIALWLIVGGLRAIQHPKLIMVGAKEQVVPGGDAGSQMLVPEFAVSHAPQVVAGVKLVIGISLIAWVLPPLIRTWRHPKSTV